MFGIGNTELEIEVTENIYPTKSLVTLEERQALYEHQGAVFWITGLPASGKTTFAYRLEQALHTNAYKVIVLDGDNMREKPAQRTAGCNSRNGFVK